MDTESSVQKTRWAAPKRPGTGFQGSREARRHRRTADDDATLLSRASSASAEVRREVVM